MSNTRQIRTIPVYEQLPRPVWARPERWDEQGSATPWHSHTWGQFSYAAQGILSVQTENASYVSPPHYGIWVPEGVTHQVVSDGAATMNSLYIDSQVLPGAGWEAPFVCVISPLFRELIIRFCQMPALYELQSAQERLAMVLLDELQLQERVSLELPMPEDRRIRTLCQQLQADPAHRWSVEQWGQNIGLSGRSISRLFVKQTGLTFQQWRQRLRFIYALNLLEQGIVVTDVALRCGYDSVSAFGEAFKKQFGCTPGQFFHK